MYILQAETLKSILLILFFLSYPVPVSYTHLDVYKRQHVVSQNIITVGLPFFSIHFSLVFGLL